MDLIGTIRQAGVVGAGGAGFPTHVKLDTHAERVIVNGAECEPLLETDQMLMRLQAEKVVRGLELAMEAAHAGEGVIATKRHYTEAVDALKRALNGKPKLRLYLMDSYYPSGDEKSVIYEITGKVVRSGELPVSAGCVVINVGTAANIADAAEGIPVTHRSVTLCGDVPEPVTVTVPIGISIRETLRASGFAGDEREYAVIIGGPCMGAIAEDWDTPVVKTTGGLVVLKNSHPLVLQRRITVAQQARLARAICCQCNRCTLLCPRNALGLTVEPHKAMRAISTGNGDLLGAAAHVLACSGCGLCTYYACEMGLTPSVVMTMLREELGKAGVRPVPEEDVRTDPWFTLKEVPVKRLIARMNLTAFDRPAPFRDAAFQPRKVKLPLRQHIGKPAEPVVRPGDRVRTGQLIGAIPENALGVALHASIDGTVTLANSQWIEITGD